LIGTRRAAAAAAHPLTKLVKVADTDLARSGALAKTHECEAVREWSEIVDDPSVKIVVVSTPNAFLAPIAIAALRRNKHVLIEKPPGRNLGEALEIASVASRAGDARLKVGFNHRYHPAIGRAYEMLRQGLIGDVLNVRARYGHGGRPGYEDEWRGDPQLAGGGELTDQGVHIADLLNWFLGMPETAYCMTQTAMWPIAPLEDNAFGILRYRGGAIASLHTSWTQWKNLFSLEIFGRKGSLSIEGLAGSYGDQRLTVAFRKPSGGAPDVAEEVFSGPDQTWAAEWDDFVSGIVEERLYLGTPEDGIAAMATIDALYRSAQSDCPVRLSA
jgi:predicted dehydrogenase